VRVEGGVALRFPPHSKAGCACESGVFCIGEQKRVRDYLAAAVKERGSFLREAPWSAVA